MLRRPEVKLALETRLLLACARSGADADAIEREIPDSLDWRDFLAAAYEHGLVPLAFNQLSRAVGAGATVPPHVLSALRSDAGAIAAQNLRFSRELISIVQAAEGAGIEMISYKGPVLAVRAYGDIALRHFADLDILVRGSAVEQTAELLTGLGYHRSAGSIGSNRDALRRWGHHEGFIGPTGTLIEVHWRFSKPLFGFAPPEREIWDESRTIEFGSTRLRTLSRAHDLLVVIAHAASHGWRQLSWLVDLDRLVALNEPAHYWNLLDTAGRLGCRRQVLLSFALARDLLGTPVAATIANAIAADRALPALERAVLKLLFGGTPTGATYAWLQFMLRDGAAERLRFFGRAAFTPTPVDLASVRLPRLLHPLYYFVRPVRLALRLRPK